MSDASRVDADRIIAAGVPVQLAGGDSTRLRFSFRSLKAIEDHYGNLNAAAGALQSLHEAAMTNLGGPILEGLGVFLGAGMGETPEAALDRLEPGDLRVTLVNLSTACVQAWLEAFPVTKSAEGNGNGGATTTDSPGETSTTSSPPSADAPTKRSLL